MSAPKPRPTDAEFDELKRKRDEAVEAMIAEVCARQGWRREGVHAHVSSGGACYCACPEGPCQHIWDGPIEHNDYYESATCSRCGTSAMSHDVRTCDF